MHSVATSESEQQGYAQANTEGGGRIDGCCHTPLVLCGFCGIAGFFLIGLAADCSKAGITKALSSYRSLSEEWIMPNGQQVFATGYDLPLGHGHSEAQLQAGIQSALPMTCRLLSANLPVQVQQFIERDVFIRAPLGHRFAAQLDPHTAIGALAQFEAALSHAPSADLEAATLRISGRAPFRLRQGLTLLSSNYSEDVALDPEWRMDPATPLPRDPPLHVVIFREPDGEVQVLEVSEEAMAALRSIEQGQHATWLEGDQKELLSWGVILPASFRP